MKQFIMIINDIRKKPISVAAAVLPFKKGNVVPIKINKSIEIVIVPNLGEINSHQDNVGIILEEKNVLKILSKRYKSVSITEINSEEDLEALVKRKPDLVFSGVKYFFFNNRHIWLNDYLEMLKFHILHQVKQLLIMKVIKIKQRRLCKKMILELQIFSLLILVNI